MITIDCPDRRYLDRLAYHLQTRRVPDERIDDILAEAQAHAAQTGETLQEAFGAPREYARRWAETGVATGRRRLGTMLGALAAATGTAALLIGSLALADDETRFGLQPGWLLVLGTAVLVTAAAVVPLRRLRDPYSGSCRALSRRAAVLSALAYSGIMAGAGVLGALI